MSGIAPSIWASIFTSNFRPSRPHYLRPPRGRGTSYLLCRARITPTVSSVKRDGVGAEQPFQDPPRQNQRGSRRAFQLPAADLCGENSHDHPYTGRASVLPRYLARMLTALSAHCVPCTTLFHFYCLSDIVTLIPVRPVTLDPSKSGHHRLST